PARSTYLHRAAPQTGQHRRPPGGMPLPRRAEPRRRRHGKHDRKPYAMTTTESTTLDRRLDAALRAHRAVAILRATHARHLVPAAETLHAEGVRVRPVTSGS